MNTTLFLIVLGVLVALAAGGYLSLRSLSPADTPVLHFLCPGCRQRLRFRAGQSGHKGKCSACGHLLSFPPASQSIA